MVDPTSVAVSGSTHGSSDAIKSGVGVGAIDQFLTTDIARFCDSLASLYGNMGKPTLDLVIFTTQLATSLGAWGTMGLFANYAFTVWILKKATPAFGKLKTIEASLKGEYRGALGRIGREAEEIA
ncbi:hypothetical protein QFC22_001780 [Naganishia vaughanmartiniae]|uniref:Uncharacterized protein n=1 Tax=Naganishia vaughanmartiniae TaxID=1424756 RepID=A0ACC2XFE4_9TREE|nr:hypothetical protein QFC22_001780 [Naganishia vaughanmartiniae]